MSENNSLEFWGKNYVFELTPIELRIFTIEEAFNPITKFIQSGPTFKSFRSIRELRVPEKTIPIKNLKRIEKVNGNLIEIQWAEKLNDIIYTTRRKTFELFERDAERFYNAISDLLRGEKFSDIYAKYRLELSYGIIIEDPETVVIIRRDEGKISFIDPKTYELMYKNKGYRAEIVGGRIFIHEPYLYKLIDSAVIPFKNLFDVRLEGRDLRGKFKLKLILTDGSKYTFKFKEHSNALQVYQEIKSIIQGLGPRKMKVKSKSRALILSGLTFTLTFYVTYFILRWFQTALPLSTFMAVVVFILYWNFLSRYF